ncbi:MAG TPA: gamma-glutamyltransferase [Gemmatimonadales bacterium]|jgi:gamma-glutamyltranspeptidase/glutathione hydrolase|nr:gamma-glutamyltransferase [Gemmatimonadales bacterium]
MAKLVALGALFPLLALALASPVSTQQKVPSMAGRSTVYAPHGVIATSQPLATAAGLAALQQGGNAIDAAVTAAAVLNLVEPHMTGIGGDMFALFWSARQRKLLALNASGRSGSLLSRDELVRRGHTSMPLFGAEPITVPGALSGWAALLERHGTISLKQALAPAIRLAEEGFPVTPIIARQWAEAAERLAQDDGARRTFLVDGVRAPRAGEWFRNPDLAASFRLIADSGPGVLYGGALGRKIVTRVKQLGGFLTLEDLASQKVEWVTPISATFRGHTVWELPPNNQGVAVLEMLRILERYDLKAMGHNTPAYLHHLIEAKKLAYADLARWVGDPAAMTIDPRRLLDDEFIAARRALLNPGKAAERVAPGAAATASETIYLAAADSAGNMVSFINSIYEEFGSGVVVPGTGFALQDRGAGFTLQPGLPNTVGPGKRPFHTLIPAFVTRAGPAGEEPWLAFGVMGGAIQPQGHVQVLLNLLEFQMDLQEAIDAARFRHYDGFRVALEAPIGASVRDALTKLGHEVVVLLPDNAGGGQAVMKLTKGWAAASDPRKDGMAAGW